MIIFGAKTWLIAVGMSQSNPNTPVLPSDVLSKQNEI